MKNIDNKASEDARPHLRPNQRKWKYISEDLPNKCAHQEPIGLSG